MLCEDPEGEEAHVMEHPQQLAGSQTTFKLLKICG